MHENKINTWLQYTSLRHYEYDDIRLCMSINTTSCTVADFGFESVCMCTKVRRLPRQNYHKRKI
jgi:hypothetical protein